jgi:hypothetical protein
VSLPATAKWILLALLGLAIAIGVAIAAANLTSQQIGIASESVSAGDALAPALRVPGGRPSHGPGDERSPGEEEPPSTTPSEPPATTGEEPAAPSEDIVEPGTESGSDDSGGHGSDGDD